MLRQKFIITYAIQFASLLLGIASGIVVARIGGPNVVGTLAFGMAFVAVFQFITDLGISTTHQKLVTSTDDTSDYIATFAVLKIVTSFLFLIILVAYFYVQVHFLNNHEIDTTEIRTVIFIYIGINFVDSLNYIFRTNFIAGTERAKVEIPSFIQSIFDKLSRIVLIMLGFGAIALATSSFLFVVLVFPINYYLFKNYKVGKFRKDLVKKYIAISLPVIIILFAQQWADNIDRILLQQMHGTYELGLYTASFSLSAPVKLLGSSIGSIFFPTFSTFLYQKKYIEISALITRYRSYLSCLFLPFILLMIIFSHQIVYVLFGSNYATTATYFPLIILTLFIFIYTLPYINLAFAKGLFKRISLISVAIFILEAGLIYLLSARSALNLKGLGTAFALLITNIVLYVLYGRTAKKILDIETNMRIFAIVIFQILLALAAKHILEYDLFFLYLSVPIVFLTLIFIIEWKMKVITKEDLKFFKSFLNMKPLLNYVKDEIGNEKLDETP